MPYRARVRAQLTLVGNILPSTGRTTKGQRPLHGLHRARARAMVGRFSSRAFFRQKKRGRIYEAKRKMGQWIHSVTRDDRPIHDKPGSSSPWCSCSALCLTPPYRRLDRLDTATQNCNNFLDETRKSNNKKPCTKDPRLWGAEDELHNKSSIINPNVRLEIRSLRLRRRCPLMLPYTLHPRRETNAFSDLPYARVCVHQPVRLHSPPNDL